MAQVFSCEFCEIFNNTFFTEHLRTTASVIIFNYIQRSNQDIIVQLEYFLMWRYFSRTICEQKDDEMFILFKMLRLKL